MAKRDDIPTADTSEIERLIERVKQGKLEQQDADMLERLLRLLLRLVDLVEQKNASIKRLKRLIFGPKSDKRQATGEQPEGSSAGSGEEQTTQSEAEQKTTESAETERQSASTTECSSSDQAPRRRGHGRRAARSYSGAQRVLCQNPKFKVGAKCPDALCGGRLFNTNDPRIFIRFTGQPFVGATLYEREVLRCSACQERVAAPLPEGVGSERYDATADVAITLARYGAGMPFHRLARLQESCGVPLCESVQFERCETVADAALPVFLKMRELAANGDVIHTDDTRVKILDCIKQDQESPETENDGRRATQTSGIVVKTGEAVIALYQSGRQHAGENLDDLLAERWLDLAPPIQMADALAANFSGKRKTIEAKCLVHGRRKFTEIEESFPRECARVLDAIKEVYRIEAETEGMNAGARLLHHRTGSGPVMEELREWIEKQFRERQIEPNSVLGQALRYLLRHWEGLTRFLSVAGAPLDNNLAERVLKRFVLMRKNSLFYKTEHGAAIGDILLSLIETCRLNRSDAWQYLVWLVRHKSLARSSPEKCLPWNYAREELEEAVAA